MSIWDSLSYIVLFAFNKFINLLPDPIGLETFTGFWNNIVNIYDYVEWIFPVHTLFVVVGVIFVVEQSYLLYWLFAKVIKIVSAGRVDL